MQAEIASSVAQALNVALPGNDRANLAEKPTTDMAAYDAFLRGEQASQGLSVRDPVLLRRAMVDYQQAVDLDPRFLQAWVQLSRAACAQTPGTSRADDAELCRRAAERASTLAPNRPEARLAMGTYLRVIQKEPEKGLEQISLGLQSQPNNMDLLAEAATAERTLGRFENALAHSQQAARLDPRSVVAANALARTYRDLRKFNEADAEYARALSLAPGNLGIVQGRAIGCLSNGDLACAQAAIANALKHVGAKAVIVRFATFQEMMWVLPDDLRRQVVELQPADFDNDRGMWALKVGATYLLMNDAEKARSYGRIAADAYREVIKKGPDDAQLLELLGRALVLAGDKQGAIQAGERSLALRETSMDATNGP